MRKKQLLALALGLTLWMAPTLPLAGVAQAFGAVGVTRAELVHGRLRVEGAGAVPQSTVVVTGVTPTAVGSARQDGGFRVEQGNSRSTTCAITVSDGSTSASTSLAGCVPEDFVIDLRTDTGFLIQGGIQSCEVANLCFGGLIEPKYVSGEITGAQSWVINRITVIGFNGFAGPVTLELLGLPEGVTSQTATSVLAGTDTTLSLRADGLASLGTTTVVLRATSTDGAIVRSVQLPITVVAELPDLVAFGLDVPPSVPGGSSELGVFHISKAAPAGGAVVSLTSSNPAVASVPATLTVPAGATSATFVVSTQPVVQSTRVIISGSIGGTTASDVLTVLAPVDEDTVSISKAEFISAKQTLHVEATSTAATATLQALVTATGELIGTLRNEGGGRFRADLPWPVNPQVITVFSNRGGTAIGTVQAK